MGRRLERDNIGSHKLSLGPGLTHGLSSGSVTHLMVIFQVTKCISEIDIRSWPNFQIGSLAFKIYLLKQQFTHPVSQARYQNIYFDSSTHLWKGCEKVEEHIVPTIIM